MSMRRKFAPVVAVALAASLALAGCGNNGGGATQSADPSNGSSGGAAAPAFSFEGQNVNFLVPTGAGGGTDTSARFIAERIKAELPGVRGIQIENIDGATHIIGMNQFANRNKHDGYNWMMSSGSGHIPYIMGESGVEFDLSTMTPILASPVGNVVMGSIKGGVTDLAALKAGASGFFYGGANSVGSDTTQLLGFAVLGLDLKANLGYDEGPQRIAFEQGEVDVMYNTTPAYLDGGKDLVDRGVGVPLYTAGQIDENGNVVTDPAFPDLPTILDVYKEWNNGAEPSGDAWEAYKMLLGTTTSFSKVMWIHGDAPEGAAETVRAAVEAMAAKPDFKEASASALGGYDMVIGEAASDTIAKAFTVDQGTLEWLKQWLRTEFQAQV